MKEKALTFFLIVLYFLIFWVIAFIISVALAEYTVKKIKGWGRF